MTLIEQYGAGHRAQAVSEPALLGRCAACALLAILLFAGAPSGSAEDSGTRAKQDPMMEQARRELGRALADRAKEVGPAPDGPLLHSDVSLYPMPLAYHGTISLMRHTVDPEVGRLLDPALMGGSATLQQALVGRSRHLVVPPVKTGLPVAERAARAHQPDIDAPLRGSEPSAKKAAQGRADRTIVQPEITGSMSPRGRERQDRGFDERTCRKGSDIATVRSASAIGYDSGCFISVRG